MSQQYAAPQDPQGSRGDDGVEEVPIRRRPQQQRQFSIGPDSAYEVARQHGIQPADRVEGVVQNVTDRDEAEARKTMEEHEQLYAANRDTLLGAINDVDVLVKQLKDFNRDQWVFHYPETSAKEDGTIASTSSGGAAGVMPPRSSSTSETTTEHTQQRPAVARSWTTPAQAKGDIQAAKDMSVLRVDLKVGTATTPSALVHSLEKSAVAQLLEGRLLSSLRQLESMRQRISDKQSKVLVTGDLNAGKSTFVNALLRRPAMPTDQQPCTTVFCEVLDAEQSNKGIEEVHVVRDGASYEAEDDDTYTVHKLDEIEDLMMKMEDADTKMAPVIKCYCKDTRATQESLLRNGVVDISLIDAPGLNRDSLKTTALFARQEEIDVIVFCVSAENHFTLSAKEFLLNASNDKAHVFIVVNKFDQITNKDRCRARVLEQIRHLSPRTYEDAESLVHFVDSNEAAGVMNGGAADMPASFANLEAALCDFVLTKRNKSKLLPAQTYLLNLLVDVDFLARTNLAVARREIAEAKEVLAVARPALKKVQADARKLENQLENEEDGVVGGIVDSARAVIAKAVDTISTGKLASEDVEMPEYPGLFGLWDYAYQVRVAMLESMERAICNVEDAARQCTKEAVDRIRNMGTEKLPQDVEKPVFVSRPEAMFAKRRANRSTAAAGLGLGAEMVEVRLSDIFDAKHHFLVITGSTEEDNAKKDHDEEMSLVNSFSLGLGALTIVGGKTLGAKTAVEAFVRISDLVGNPTVRRWALPIFLVASTGMVVWTIIDLPNSIPRNIGRSLAKELKTIDAPVTSTQAEKEKVEEQEKATAVAPTKASAAPTSLVYTFAEIQSRRVGRETRKVIRLAGYDVNERFRVAIAARKHQVQQQELKERKATTASTYFVATRGDVGRVRTQLQGLSGWEH